MFPGQHQTRTGIPSLVTAIPMITWGRSSRWSLDFPQVRNPAGSRAPSSSLPVFSLVTALPFASRATGSSASSVTKYVEVVSKNCLPGDRGGSCPDVPVHGGAGTWLPAPAGKADDA